MRNYKVKVSNEWGDAPDLYVSAKTEFDAEAEARRISGLGKFEEWNFIPSEIKKRK